MAALDKYLLFLKGLPKFKKGILVVLKKPISNPLYTEGVFPFFIDVPPVLFISGKRNVRDGEKVCMIRLFPVKV